MEFLRKYLTQIKAQLTGLTLSQRLLIGLLVLLMIGTVFFAVTFSAKPEMVVLIPQPMSSEEINRAEMALKSKYSYVVQGDRIMVPADKAYQIRGELFAAQALPKDTTQAFARLMEDSDYLRPEASNQRRWDYARQETLAKILRNFPYIEDANVIISKGDRAGLGRDAVPSSATVTIKVRGGEPLSGAQVVAIVDMVRGAVAGMKREDVHVTDGMRPYHAPSSDTPMPTDILAWKKTIEEDLAKKLYVVLSTYGDVKIAVNVMPDMAVKTIRETKYDPKVVKATVRETSHEEKSEDATVGGQPGVLSNTSVVTTSTGRGSSTSNNQSTVENLVKVSQTDTVQTSQPGTEFKRMTASISLPRSYFVSIFRRAAKDQKADPEDTDPKLRDIIENVVKRVQASAEKAIGADADNVRVDWFDDTIIARGHEPGEVAKASALGGTIASLVPHTKTIFLASIALLGLWMMVMMVRRAVPAGAGGETDPSVFFGGGTGRKKGEPSQLDAGEDVYGEAGEGEAVLTGIELDDETLQSRKIVDEVSAMIKENPENAAALVKKWISKGK